MQCYLQLLSQFERISNESIPIPIIMTRASRHRILKDDANSNNISNHLRNHIHLTNCIHLKNHMHNGTKPISSDAKQHPAPAVSRKGISVIPSPSDNLSSSTNSDNSGDEFPLLVDASTSGELGIFADNLLKTQEIDSDPERGPHEHRGSTNSHHQSLTQKYMPRTFKEILGQNLVVRALSNAIVKRKVGPMYVFYGPHGTGKTTCARVFARALNCQSINENPKPCGLCDSCVEGRDFKEIRNTVSNIDFGLSDVTKAHRSRSRYKVLVFDECDTFSSDRWSTILRAVDWAPRRVVFILVCSTLDVLPRVVISRCQKFGFNKLKDAEIVLALQWIATKENLEIDRDALKLIASRSNGSLRDAEMTLEQLSLLGHKISLCLVQEMAGIISDEKLVELLDLALSADTVNTVKNVREIMESGVEPLVLMSQLANAITDILVGSYVIVKERPRMKFFQHQALSRDEMEKLRQALKTLSEAEKQLRVTNDRMTWLIAALLQLAPNHNTNLNHNPIVFTSSESRERTRKLQQGLDEIWLEVLEKIPINSLREFMYREGKLVSLGYGPAPTVQLLVDSQLTKSEVEKYRSHVLHAFESVLGSHVTIEIKCESRKDTSEIVELGDNNQSLDLVRGKRSLRHVIDRAEGCSQHNEWPSNREITNPEFLCLKTRTSIQKAFLKFVYCGRCYIDSSTRP